VVFLLLRRAIVPLAHAVFAGLALQLKPAPGELPDLGVDHGLVVQGNGDPPLDEPEEVIAIAAAALWRATGDATGLVPIVAQGLQGNVDNSIICMKALAEMGAAAKDALPELRKAFPPDVKESEEAANSRWKHLTEAIANIEWASS